MNRLLTGPLSLEQVTVAIANLPRSLDGLRVVQMSDFHYDGLRLSDQLLLEAIDTANQLRPDAVFLTGDYVTDDPTPIDALARYLSRLNSRYGTFAVLGNHDLYQTGSRKRIKRALQAVGIQVLWNAIAYPFGSELPIVGLAEFSSKQLHPSEVLTQVAPEMPRIVLVHNPDSAASLAEWRVDLQLSGHTHGGQIVLPGMGSLLGLMLSARKQISDFAAWLPGVQQLDELEGIVRHWEWSQGLHQIGANQLYVNRGLGTYLPGRLFCPPEVTVITLKQR